MVSFVLEEVMPTLPQCPKCRTSNLTQGNSQFEFRRRPNPMTGETEHVAIARIQQFRCGDCRLGFKVREAAVV